MARGGFSDGELALPQETIAVRRRRTAGGPLAGVAGAIQWLAGRRRAPPFLLSVAVDTPFFPADFLAKALQTIGENDAVVARFAGQDYPTNALWRVSAVAGRTASDQSQGASGAASNGATGVGREARRKPLRQREYV